VIFNRSEFKVLKTTPDQPASKERATISALLETGEEESRKGFLKVLPQNSMERSMDRLDTIVPPVVPYYVFSFRCYVLVSFQPIAISKT
jgi:hypothetical protein